MNNFVFDIKNGIVWIFVKYRLQYTKNDSWYDILGENKFHENCNVLKNFFSSILYVSRGCTNQAS